MTRPRTKEALARINPDYPEEILRDRTTPTPQNRQHPSTQSLHRVKLHFTDQQVETTADSLCPTVHMLSHSGTETNFCWNITDDY